MDLVDRLGRQEAPFLALLGQRLGQHPLVPEAPALEAAHGADLGRTQPIAVEGGDARRIHGQLLDLGVAQDRVAPRPGEIRLSAEIPVERSAWFALRSSGVKLGEHGPMPDPIPQWVLEAGRNVAAGAGGIEIIDYFNNMKERASAAHTAAIYVGVAGASPAATSSDLPRAWLARLAELEDRLSDDRIAEIPIWDWIPYSDGVSEEHLRYNRDALLEAIAQARPFYQRQIVEGD